MKTQRLFLLAITLIIGLFMNAQVGINTDAPRPNAVLDIKTKDATEHKGILLPQSTETDRDGIPVVTATENGLVLYNQDEDCFNYWSTSGNEWKSLCGSLGKAQFTLQCNTLKAMGDYVINKDMTTANYLTLKVDVTKPGIWSITATSDPNNGYSFTGSGVFTEKGIQTINIPAQGTPKAVKTDTFTITSSGGTDNCTVDVVVKTNIASYSLNCATIAVNGTYVKGTNLGSGNTITLNVNVVTLGSYTISTPVTNGISFSASGTFTSTGMQQVTLLGSGSPTVNLDFPITINSNTTDGNNTCSATIPMTLPAMTYAIIGTTDTWSWGAPERRNALASTSSFGPSGIVKIVGLSVTPGWGTTTSVSNAVSYLANSGMAKPDVILYFAYGAAPTATLSTSLSDYINKGGSVIYGSADGTSTQVNILMNGIFGASSQTAVAQIGGTQTDDNVYQIANFPNDPVINGPFGNLSGRYWGEDNGSTGSVVFTSLPANSIQVCSAYNSTGKQAVSPDNSILWYNDTKNFIFFGDSVGASNTDNTSGAYPSVYTSAGVPRTKLYGPGSSSNQYVYNSALELNAVAWALKKAASSGINPH